MQGKEQQTEKKPGPLDGDPEVKEKEQPTEKEPDPLETAAGEKTAQPSDEKPTAEMAYPYHHQPYHLQPERVVHSYNVHRPGQGVSEYVYLKPQEQVITYVDSNYDVPYHPHQNNATLMFNDEDPNACSVMQANSRERKREKWVPFFLVSLSNIKL
uniref:Uncharacterized protein n=1 Tax=Wolffia arrhiza TaxID=161111 RepID=D2XQX7_WOLAR|nr:hypothetical protein [Wolffia arrhiza]